MFPEWTNAIVLHDSLCMVNHDGMNKSRHKHVHREMPKWASNSRVLGEAGVVSLIEDKTPKLNEKGVTCMFVGHAEQCAQYCYRMWCKKVNKCYSTRDVVFLH